MGKHYSDKFKNQIIKEYLDGNSGGSKTLAKKYNISFHTIDTWIQKYKRQGNLDNDINHTRGRKRDKEIDKTYNYSTTKNIDLYATAVLPYSIETVTVGQVLLEDVAGFSETVDATDVVDNVGNPKTGDINIVKYLSIALVGICTVLMVIQIKRKYSTKKNKVLF